MQKEVISSMETYLEIDVIFKRLDKHLGCKSSLEAYPQIYNMILDDNFGLNLCIMLTVSYIAIISDDKVSRRSEKRCY